MLSKKEREDNLQEGHKFKARDRYLVTQLDGKNTILQKCNNNGAFMSKPYSVPLSNIFPASPSTQENTIKQHEKVLDDTSSDSD